VQGRNFEPIKRFVLLATVVLLVLFAGSGASFALSASGVANNHNPSQHTLKLDPGEVIFVHVQCAEPVRIETFSMKLAGAEWAYKKLGETRESPRHRIKLSAPNKPPANNMSHWHIQLRIWGEGEYTLYTEPAN